MAAIIAQMAAANRERKKMEKLRGRELPANKGTILLPPFPRGAFDPKKHNR